VNIIIPGKLIFMAAYVYVELTLTDPEGFREYVEMAPLSIEAYGGKYLLRSKPAGTLEGSWPSQIMVILEFPSAQRAREWWNSAEYAAAKEIRHKTADTKMIVFESF
jgi:uncharacterized protein (DUF1330 family)